MNIVITPSLKMVSPISLTLPGLLQKTDKKCRPPRVLGTPPPPSNAAVFIFSLIFRTP
jgi:hypothetical protein